jgi:hypothetical protein
VSREPVPGRLFVAPVGTGIGDREQWTEIGRLVGGGSFLFGEPDPEPCAMAPYAPEPVWSGPREPMSVEVDVIPGPALIAWVRRMLAADRRRRMRQVGRRARAAREGARRAV